MSWLGGSISSLTGQLSNLTKDILTEGTEEIDDPTTELRLAKEKIEQLNVILSTQRHENERLKRLNKELEEKAESSELQINTISREYRGVLEGKEREVNALKHQHQELLEQQVQSAALLLPSRDGAITLTSSVSHSQDQSQNWASSAGGGEKFASYNYDGDHGDWDFDDSIRLQRENNSLRAELQKLQSEVKHWRSVSEQMGQNAAQNSNQYGPSVDVLDLQHKVKNVESQLAKKSEEMQQQATSLHEHHRQKVSNLKSGHKTEIELLKSNHQAEIDTLKSSYKTDIDSLHAQLAALEQQLVNACDGGNSSQRSGSNNLPESDQLNERELELQRRLSEALSEKEKFQNACSHLESLLGELQQKTEQLQQHQTVAEDEVLQHKVTELTRLLQESETLRLGLKKEIEEADAQKVLSELREMKDNMSTEIGFRRNEMRTERCTLVNQLFRVVQQRNQLTQSLQSAKKEQEMVLAKAEASVEEIGDRGQQEITAELLNILERENLLLKEEKLKLEEQIALLEKVASTGTTEKQALLRRIKDLKSQLQNLTGHTDGDTDDTEDLDFFSENSGSDSKNAALHVHSEDVDRELALLRDQLSSQTEDATALEMERSNWQIEREALEDVITDLRRYSEEQEQEIRSMKSGETSIASQESEHPIEGDASGKLQALEEEISSLRKEKIELEDALEELDTQHCQAQDQLIKQRDHLIAQLSEHTVQIQQQNEEIEQLNKWLKEAQDVQRPVEDEREKLDIQQRLLLEEKCKRVEAELAELKSKSFNSSIEKEIADLREKLSKGGLVINDLHMDKQELEEELKSAKEETAVKVQKVKEMREANVILEKEKKMMSEKILEMEDRLSEMEEEVEKWQQVNEEKQVQQMNAWKEHEEVKRLMSQVSTMEKEKLVFSEHFSSLSSKQPCSDFSLEDAAFGSILQEEAKVRKKIEQDNCVIMELRDEVQKLYESKQSLKQSVRDLQSSQEASTSKITQLENELQEARALIESVQKEKSDLEMILEEDETDESVQYKMSTVNSSLEELKKQNEELLQKLFTTEEEKSNLAHQIESNRIQYESVVQKLKSEQHLNAESQHQELLKMIDNLQAEVKLKTSLEVTIQSQNQEIEELSKKAVSVEEECDSLHTEIIRLESLCVEKDKEIRVLKERLLHFDTNLTNSEEIASNAESTLSLHVRDGETHLLETKHSSLEKSVNHVQNDLKSFNKEQHILSQELSYSEEDVSELKREIERLKNEISEDQYLQDTVYQLEAELTACNEKISEFHKDLSHANEIIKRQEAGIIDFNEKTDIQRRQLQKAETDVELQKSTIAVLRQTSIDKDTSLSEIEKKMEFVVALLTDQQKEYLQNYSPLASDLPALEYKQVPAIEFLQQRDIDGSSTVQEKQQSYDKQPGTLSLVNEKTNREVNGSVDDDDDFDSSTSDRDRCAVLEKEIDELNDRLKEKDAVVAELQKSSSFLLTLIEKEGSSLDKNSSSHFSLHKMDAELRSLRAEREQMMAVVAEKSRESSYLKNEVHRLMDVASAGNAAIEKLQQDNRSLEQRRHSPPRDDGEDDMRREALTNIAKLVRDRETEIEALKQKNDTLLAVLHEPGTSQAAAHLAPLLRDKEVLMQQISALTSEREQLITCVTQKHSESVAYHAEVQRLTTVLAESQSASEKIRQDYSTLIPAFEDKSQSLLATQNELIKYKQKLTDLEVRHGELIQRSSSQDSPSSTDLSSLENDLEILRNRESEMRTTLSQQEEKIHFLSHRISTLEESLTSKDTECALLRKQMEKSKFQIADLLAEVSNLKSEREQIQHQTSLQSTESASLRESYNRMCLEVRDKGIEVSSLKEQVTTLTSILSEQQGEQGQVTQLMRENEAVMSSARQLQHERDQQAMLAEQKSHECNGLRNEMATIKDKELRLSKELERLRAHLMEIEEGFTNDALEAEEREKDLRNKLAVAEEHMMSSSFQVDTASKESRRQIETLQQQLQHVANQRDSAYMQVANIQEQCQQYANSLGNLQLVLEHFQKEKDSAIAMETERLQNECKVLRVQVRDLQTELQATRDDLTDALDGLQAASRLSEQLDRKEDTLAALKEEVQLREQALNAAEEEIRKLNSSTEAKVDKMLMHNVVMTWLLSPENQQMEIVHLMGNILSFSPEDFQKIEAAHKKGGLLSGFFGRTSTAPPSPARKAQANQSFSQLFVKFLEEESSPAPTPVRLPAESMAAETQYRYKSTFNPFTAPRHVTQDMRRASTPSSHILMTPDSPTSTPLFSPLTSIPSSTESSILKDVLGNR